MTPDSTAVGRLYLSAPVNAIVEGIYEERVPFSEIKRHGDFGDVYKRQALYTMTNPSRLYLSAPVNAIVEGIYEERVPFSEIKRHGDFGLGTFDLLDGEMVMLDGRVYQMTADGCVQEVGDDALTPFACVTFFRPEEPAELDGEMSYDAFLRRLRAPLPSANIFYAFRIEGCLLYTSRCV